MNIAIVENNVVKEVGDYRNIFPSTSFSANGPSDEFLVNNNAMRVNLWKPYDHLTQKLVSSAPYVEEQWVYCVAVESLSAEEVEAAKQSAMASVRSQRNAKLASCDWTQLADSQVDKAVWADYRQQLRNLPASIEDARYGVTWPTEP